MKVRKSERAREKYGRPCEGKKWRSRRVFIVVRKTGLKRPRILPNRAPLSRAAVS